MSKPAARITDMHVCPMVTPGTPPVPHVGGPINGPGVPTVLIGGLPAAVVGDMCTCVGPPDTIAMGSTTVLIGGKQAARMGDMTVHGGTITIGCPTVLIGDVSGGVGGMGFGSSSIFSGFLDKLQLALDLAGLIPGLGEIADFANGLISVGRGNYGDAALSFAAMVPFAGVAATAGKLGSKSKKAFNVVQNSPADEWARKKMAYKFYRKNNPNMKPEKVKEHMQGIDFSKPVEVVEVKKGTKLQQWQVDGDRKGQYFTADKDVKPTDLGINPKRINKDSGKVETKTQKEYVVNENVEGLNSTSAPVKDTWSDEANPFQTKGGADQLYIPNNQTIK